MGVRVAYGNRSNINAAIAAGIIPPDSIIITRNSADSAELMFYDIQTNLKHIVSKTKFQSVDEALDYAKTVGIIGQFVTVFNGERYDAFIIQPGCVLEPLQGGSSGVEVPESLIERVENLEAYSHVHNNQTLLDSLTNDMVQRWNDAAVLADGISDGLQLVRSTDAENGVKINEDGTMTINAISLSCIVQSDDEELIINGN